MIGMEPGNAVDPRRHGVLGFLSQGLPGFHCAEFLVLLRKTHGGAHA